MAKLCYAEKIHSDCLKIVVGLGTSKNSALLPHGEYLCATLKKVYDRLKFGFVSYFIKTELN